MEEEAVVVEHADADQRSHSDVPELTEEKGPYPIQIVSIGTEDDAYAFTFHEDKLNEIIRKIPPGWKVAVVSVVGAFRTGKSFLLSWFLKYLHHLTSDKEDSSKKWYQQVQNLTRDAGFDWRGGSERNTTGIWMWSQPHFVTKPTDDGTGKETMAVLLVDSQGMFDNETTMSLTASIFGLSTLLSSYQIYNVDKRIQEDNLQQLALFSEYARLAVEADQSCSTVGVEAVKPFQRMEFLVRDWQHFEEEGDYDVMTKEMGDYLDKVIAERDAKDLQETREQILGCFESLSCFGLCHPGMSVIKKSYDGSVDKIEKDFLELLDRYCKRVFSVDNLKAKTIQGRQVTAAELAAYIKAYAAMFASGASFPEASTMLEATAAANNQNAVNLAIAQYKETMNRIAGPKCSNYIRPQELKEDHKLLLAKALQLFDSMATFGSKKAIEGARMTVIEQIHDDFEVFTSLNDSRNPLAGFETYALPLTVALVAFILRWIADTTCSPYSKVCRKSSDFLSHVYAVVVIFLLIVGATKAKQIKDLVNKVKTAFEVMNSNSSDNGKQKKD